MKKAIAIAVTFVLLIPFCSNLLAQTQNNPVPRKNAAKALPSTTAATSFQIAPAPPWTIVPTPAPAGTVPRSAMHYELLDTQIRVEGASQTSYEHQIRVVDTTAGLGPAAQIEITIDPAYQSLTIHHISVVRNGTRINKLDRQKIQMLQRETQLEARIYNGQVTASIVLDDVRVSDKVDFAYSVKGANPVFDGRLVATQWMLVTKGAADLQQFRLLAPEARNIMVQAGALVTTTTTVQNGMRDTRFVRTAISQWENEPQASPSAFLDATVQLSEFTSWADVGRWGSSLFASALASSAGVRQQADLIRASATTPENRVVAALNFVQKEIRYFGTELGQSSHRPQDAAVILRQRFGDCKDKVALLIALLHELGIDAEPVLVSTVFQEDLARLLPSPLAFDHVIARVTVSGQTYWLDGTRNFQTGGLQLRQSTGLGKGLTLRADNLIDLPGGEIEQRVSVRDALHVAKMKEAPILESRITYFGAVAEYLRSERASTAAADFAARQRDVYLRLYPKLEPIGELGIEEDTAQNAMTMAQQFRLPEFWRLTEQRSLAGELAAWSFLQALRSPSEAIRKQPFRQQAIGIYQHEITVDLPVDLLKPNDSKESREDSAFFDLRQTTENSARQTRMKGELRILKPVVTPAEWAAFQEASTKARKANIFTLQLPPMSVQDRERLRTTVNEFERKLKDGPRSAQPTTRIQFESQVRELILSATLDADLLMPKPRAAVLTDRGTARDHLGKMALAAEDFQEALKLAPDNTETISSAAVNALMSGDDARAVDLAKQALQRAPSDTEALSSLGTAQYFSEDYAGASDTMKTLLGQRTVSERGYLQIWLYFSTKRSGDDGVAALAAYPRTTQGEAPWPWQVVDWLNGKTSLEQVLRTAFGDGKDPSRLCEAFYFIGERFLADGNTVDAKKYFQKAVDTHVTEFREYAFAKRRLAAM